MNTPSASASPRAQRVRLAGLDGRVVAGAATFLALALLVLGPKSLASVVVISGLGLALAGVAASRWPLATLVSATLLTLLDEALVPRVLPDGADLGPIGLSEPMLVVVGAVLAVRAVRVGTLLPALRDPVIAIGALFVLVAAVSAVVNRVPVHVATLGIVMTIDALALYTVARTLRADERQATSAIAGVVAVITAIALFGIAQIVVAPTLLGFSTFTGRFGEGVRITSIIGNPNMLAATVGIAIPFALYGSRHLGTERRRWAARACLFVLVLALLLTFSRGGWLAVALGVVVGALIVDWRSVPVFVLATVLAWGATVVLPRNVGLDTLGLDPEDFGGSIIDTTFNRLDGIGQGTDVRAQYLIDGVRIISDNLVLGVGPGRYGGAAATILPSPVYDEYDAGLYGFRTVHNFWLHLTGEVGAIGVAVFITMIVGLLIRFARAAHRATGGAKVVVGGAATVLIVVSLNSLTEMLFEGNLPGLLIWLVLGIASVLAPAVPIFTKHDEASGTV